MPTALQLGYRIAAARAAAGLTRLQAAAASGVSVSMIRKIEGGERTPSDSTLDQLAATLGTTAGELLAGPGRTDSRVHQAIPRLQQAIAAYDLPEDGPGRPLRELAASVETLTQQRVNSQYAQLAENAPGILEELFRAAATAADPSPPRAARLLVLALRAADAAAYKYAYTDLSARLIELMRWAADAAQDPALTAAVAYVRTETFFAAHRLGAGLRALQDAVDAMPAPPTTQLAAAEAALHMRAAVVAGRMHDLPQARDHLAHAERLVDRIPERLYDGTAVGPDSLRIHRLAVAVELGDATDLATAVAEATRWAPPRDMASERRSHYYIDLGRAQVQLGHREHALESLQVARRIAPQHVREHGQVRAGLETLLRLSRGRHPELVAFCQWAGVA